MAAPADCSLRSFNPAGIGKSSTNYRSRCFIDDLENRNQDAWKKAQHECVAWDMSHLGSGQKGNIGAALYDCQIPPDAYSDTRSWARKIADGFGKGIVKATEPVQKIGHFVNPGKKKESNPDVRPPPPPPAGMVPAKSPPSFGFITKPDTGFVPPPATQPTGQPGHFSDPGTGIWDGGQDPAISHDPATPSSGLPVDAEHGDVGANAIPPWLWIVAVGGGLLVLLLVLLV